MADDEVVIACTSLIYASLGAAIAVLHVEKSNKRKHKTWVNNYIRRRDNCGTFNSLLPQLDVVGKYCQYRRMDIEVLEEGNDVNVVEY
jgi:hypothetical protein